MTTKSVLLKDRFDGYLPVVIDVETAGVDATKNALLEVAAVLVHFNEEGNLVRGETFSSHVIPFEGAVLDPVALNINKIDPFHPFRFALSEHDVLEKLFTFISDNLQKQNCRRGVLVGHNAHFDLSFLQAAMRRTKLNNSPLHAFTCFDTATLAGLFFGKTILAKALKVAAIEFDKEKAHSALYDAEKTADLFCQIVNGVDHGKRLIKNLAE